MKEGAKLKIYDPKVSFEQIKNDLVQKNQNLSSVSKVNNWEVCDDLYETTIGADAIVILTNCEEFKNLNWSKITKIRDCHHGYSIQKAFQILPKQKFLT